jgi:hypothetical protein
MELAAGFAAAGFWWFFPPDSQNELFWPFRRAFFRRQYGSIVFVASANHSRSANSAISSTALKNFTAFGFGLPQGRSFPALRRRATSSVVQFRSFAT